MSGEEDSLLYILSSLREISWSRYKDLFGSLYSRSEAACNEPVAKIEHLRYRTLKALASLGHCDFYFENGSGRIYSSPSVLARLPVSGFPKALLCGSRGPDTVSKLAETCKARGCECQVDTQTFTENTPFVPRRIVVESDDTRAIASVAADLTIRFAQDPPSWILANYAPTIDEYSNQLPWESGQTLNWQREDFNPKQVKFSDPLSEEPSVRLSRYKDPIRGTNCYFVFRNNQRAQVDVDWGRYLLLHSTRQSLLIYDTRKFTLAVPVTAPLPAILARSAVLCTGYVTRSVFTYVLAGAGEYTGTFELYEGIPEPLANRIAEKLGQRLLVAQIDTRNEARQ